MNWFTEMGQSGPAPDNWFTNLGDTTRKVGGWAQNTLESPLFQGGAALASGEGFSGMQKGIQAGGQFAELRQKQQQRQRFDSLLRNPDFTKGSDPRVVQYSQAAQDPSLIARQGLPEEIRAQKMHPYEMQRVQAQAEKLRREAADGSGGYAKEIKPYQTADGKIFGVQAGARGDALIHDLSKPGSPPIVVPAPRGIPAGMVPLAGAPGMPQQDANPPPQAGPLMPPTGAPAPTRTVHPPLIASAGPSAGMAPSQDTGRPAISQAPGGLFDDRRYGETSPTEPDIPMFSGQPMSTAQTGAGSPPVRVPMAAPQAAAQPPAGRQMPGALTPYRGVKQVGKHMIDAGSGRIVTDVEDSIRGGKFVEEDAKAAVADIKSRNDAIESSRGKLPRLEMISELINLPEVYQGTGARHILELKKAAQALGIDVGDVSGSEAVQMISNQFALALRNPAGGEGMPGSMSDRDLSFLVSSAPGLTNTRQGNQLMARVMIDQEKYKMRANTEAARYLQGKRSTSGLPEHMTAWTERNPALSKEVRDKITALTGIQYGVQNGPAGGPSAPKQFSGRLNEPTAADQRADDRGSFASPGIGSAIPTIRGDTDYQSLPAGSQYYAPDGSLRRKH